MAFRDTVRRYRVPIAVIVAALFAVSAVFSVLAGNYGRAVFAVGMGCAFLCILLSSASRGSRSADSAQK